MIKNKLNHSYLLSNFKYNHDTGELTRLSNGHTFNLPRKDGYIQFRIKGSAYLAHRVIFFYFYNYMPEQIDHVNHDRSDNRLSNLRPSNNADNHKNRTLNKNNVSKCCGVTWHKSRQLWQTYIIVNYKNIFLGRFADKFEAICARKSAEIKHKFHRNHGR